MARPRDTAAGEYNSTTKTNPPHSAPPGRFRGVRDRAADGAIANAAAHQAIHALAFAAGLF